MCCHPERGSKLRPPQLPCSPSRYLTRNDSSMSSAQDRTHPSYVGQPTHRSVYSAAIGDLQGGWWLPAIGVLFARAAGGAFTALAAPAVAPGRSCATCGTSVPPRARRPGAPPWVGTVPPAGG